MNEYVRDPGNRPRFPDGRCLILQFGPRTPPFEPISMNQDDSKQCEHLLCQENDPS